MEPILVYMTTETIEEAEKIGSALVEERLAACANVLPGMKSIYRWENKIEKGSECVLIAKTRKDLLGELEAKVKEMHSYSCPCIVSVPISGGNPDFIRWIGEETR